MNNLGPHTDSMQYFRRSGIAVSLLFLTLAAYGLWQAIIGDSVNRILGFSLAIPSTLLAILFSAGPRFVSIDIHEQGLRYRRLFRQEAIRWVDIAYVTHEMVHESQERVFFLMMHLIPIWIRHQGKIQTHQGITIYLKDGSSRHFSIGKQTTRLKDALDRHIQPKLDSDAQIWLDHGGAIPLTALISYDKEGIQGIVVKGTGKRQREVPFHIKWNELTRHEIFEQRLRLFHNGSRIASIPVHEIHNLRSFLKIAHQQTKKV